MYLANGNTTKLTKWIQFKKEKAKDYKNKLKNSRNVVSEAELFFYPHKKISTEYGNPFPLFAKFLTENLCTK